MAPVRDTQMASDWVAAVLQFGRMVIMDMVCSFVWGGGVSVGCGGFGGGEVGIWIIWRVGCGRVCGV